MKILTGDLIEARETYLCHQCNCITNRSKHLARTVFNAYPYADIYAPRTKPDLPGDVVIRGNGKNQRYIAALLGQYYPGKSKYKTGKDSVSIRLKYFNMCLEKLELLAVDGASFAFPWRIGCGAAGGDWGLYQKALKSFSIKINSKVIIYRLPDPFFKELSPERDLF